MSGMGKCCCGDCCLEEGEMPYTTATLKSPYYPCEGGGGPGGGVGVGVGEGEEPSYPTENFVKQTCCYQAGFNFDLNGQCTEEVFNCFLWAKRDVTFSYTVSYYRQKIAYHPAETDPEDYDCPCILATTKSVDYEGAARVFLNQSYQLYKATVSVGKTKIKCDGDSEPVCKFYIAVTYDFRVKEGPSDVQVYNKKTFSCVGNFDNPNCTITNSWIEESGTDSDACPFDDFQGGPIFETIVSVTRIKFYDALPAPGDITIAATDSVPFSCCDGKVNCTIEQQSCGLLVGSNCLPAAPYFNEFMDPANSYNLIPCSEVLQWDEETDQWQCFRIMVDGYMESRLTVADVFLFGIVLLAPDCYYHAIEQIGGPSCPQYSCDAISMGWDSLTFSEVDFVNQGEGLSPCGTLDVNYLIEPPSPPVGPYCSGGASPPELGFCTTDDCCVEGVALNFCDSPDSVSTLQCPVLGPDCGRKITDLECSHALTNYSVGATCLPIGNAIIGLA